VRRGLAPSRAEAKRLVEDRAVVVRGVPTPKPTTLVSPDTPIDLVGEPRRYVSRGAYKLIGALDAFGIDVEGRRALDAGASTGGFTQVLLERGASEVVALDVGYGQLDQRLRDDERVVVMERTNLRHVTPEDTGGRFSMVVADLSFISLCTVAPALARLADDDADLVLLIKPQFEAGKGEVGRGGIVRDDDVRRRAVEKALRCLTGEGLTPVGIVPSPITGADGNREFLAWCRPGADVVELEVPA
jgi:23S rRNA (cytidine1920-2'-O)/16S rRNA (cytidine1409-2'-O)-methyltransferase